MLGVADDGNLGPITMLALQRAWKVRDEALLDEYHTSRLAFYKLLSDYAKFGRGWDARAGRCLALSRLLLS